MEVTPHPPVPDLLELELPAEATVVVLGDLHLRGASSDASRRVEELVGARLDAVAGPAAVVLNGDVIDLWADPELTVEAVLDAHPRLAAALAAFAAPPGRHLVLVVGNHDARLAWDDVPVKALAARLGCRCALAVELVLATPAGARRVRVEHGHGFDPVNAQRDPRNPLDSPLGQHIVQEVLPRLTGTPLLADLGNLADGGDAARFAVSRTLYRQVGPRLWWLLLPVAASLALRVPVMVHALAHAGALDRAPLWLPVAVAAVLVDVAGLAVVLTLLTRSLYSSVAVGSIRPGGGNGAPAAAAAALCRRGYAGLITGHTHAPELSPVSGGFYANSGCALRCLQQRPARLGLPPVFVPILRVSWVELLVEHDLRARLMLAEAATGESTRLERLAHRGRLPRAGGHADVAEVAALPHAGYPLRSLDLDRRRRQERVRGWAALAVAGVGLVSLGSAVTWPFQSRLRDLLALMPLDIPQAASATVAFLSVALILLGRGLRRGHRLAWGLAVGLLAGASVLHLLKGLDLEESLATAVVAGWLARNRSAFPVRAPARRWRLILPVVAGAVLAASFGLVLLLGRRPGLGLADVLARLFGGGRLLPGTRILDPALSAAGLALLLAAGLILTRIGRDRVPSAAGRLADRERARRLVQRYGGDTLAYFALRDDKSWFFTGDCVVAYALRDGVCLVSPDPVGPPEQWAPAWAEFTAFADRHGWPLAVVGAGEGWLPVYVASGLRSLYMGDEAVVDCPAFSLEGRPMKQLRSACSRVRRAGYTVRFHDPATLPPALAGQLREVLTQSRRGQVERGFSMTLSRVFDPADTGLLLSVAYRPDGTPAGFCQWTPAPGIDGWSLDLMRRAADEDVPNGLIEFLVIETIRHVAAAGQWGLSLNFAVMRAVLAGEQGDGPFLELQARILNRFSDSMQIASLWRFNQKFRPIWRPRFIAVGRLSSAPVQTLAIADAEGVTELPVIGRFLGRPRRG